MTEISSDPDLSDVNRQNVEILQAFHLAVSHHKEQQYVRDRYKERGGEPQLTELLEEILGEAQDDLAIATAAMKAFYADHKDELHELALEEDDARHGR